MRPYLAILRLRFVALLQYRAAAAAGLATQVFWGFIRVMILTAFYASSTVPAPMTLEDTVSYVWLGQALLMLLPYRAEPEAENLVRTGNVAFELLRPVSLYGLWFARAVSMKTAPTLLRSLPILVLAFTFFGLRPPPSAASGAAFGAALLMTVLLSSAITTLLSVTLLVTVSGRGINWLMNGCVWVLSGMVLPLPLFPDRAQAVLAFLPFRGLMDAPFRLWLGHLSPAEALPVLVHQALWTAAFVLLGAALLRRAARRLAVQGG